MRSPPPPTWAFSVAKKASNDCPNSMCGDMEIKFPFVLNSGSKNCRAAGLSANLSCSSANETILTLPSSETYRVRSFHYENILHITVQLSGSYHNSSCPWLEGLGNLPDTTGSIFANAVVIGFVLLNCTNRLDWPADDVRVAGPISCLSELGYYVYAMDDDSAVEMLPPHCTITTSGELLLADGFQSLRDFVQKTVKGQTATLQVLDYIENSGTCFFCAYQGKNCGYNNERKQTFCLQELHRGMRRYVKGIVIGTAVLVFLISALVVVYFIKKYSNEREKRIKIERFLATYKSTALSRYSYADIKKITQKFKHKLGQGGFGIVYKGELKNGVPVAVKMIEASKSNGEDFVNEVSTIGKIHHVNVVRLLGFCSEGSNRALVYEFMPNESLEKFIFLDGSNKKIESFGTEKLQDIAVGIAVGIDYLHRGCNQRILHFDIKPHNILLDYDFNPKVSDFGLAKLCSRDRSIVTMSAARGTMGYMAPEIYSRNFGPVSHKSDVYSYGMLLLEMVGRRKNVDPSIENVSEIYYPEWIYNKLLQSNDLEIAMEMEHDEKILRKLAVIALWCIQWNPSERPSMTRVVQMLTGDLQSLEMPPKPFVPSSGQHANADLSCISEEVPEV